MLIVRNEVIIGILSHLYLSFQLFEAPPGPGVHGACHALLTVLTLADKSKQLLGFWNFPFPSPSQPRICRNI